MNIYQNKKQNSFVAVDLEKEIFSTRSSFPEKFFHFLETNQYSFFEFNKQNEFVKANEKEIIFSDIKKENEIYTYIGEATNKEELINLLKNQAVVWINYSSDGFLTCTRKFSENFCFPGGKIEKNETEIEALIREVKEEVGIDIKEEDVSFYKLYKIKEFNAYIFISFIENLKPYQNEEGVIPSFKNLNDLLSDKAEFKEFNSMILNDLKSIYL